MAAIAGYVSPAGNLCHFFVLNKDESCPTADQSITLGRLNGPAYSTGELLNTPLVWLTHISDHRQRQNYFPQRQLVLTSQQLLAYKQLNHLSMHLAIA